MAGAARATRGRPGSTSSSRLVARAHLPAESGARSMPPKERQAGRRSARQRVLRRRRAGRAPRSSRTPGTVGRPGEVAGEERLVAAQAPGCPGAELRALGELDDLAQEEEGLPVRDEVGREPLGRRRPEPSVSVIGSQLRRPGAGSGPRTGVWLTADGVCGRGGDRRRRGDQKAAFGAVRRRRGSVRHSTEGRRRRGGGGSGSAPGALLRRPTSGRDSSRGRTMPRIGGGGSATARV